MKRLAILLALTLAGCGVSNAASAITVVVGYQSKTINTVTAGTLLRSQGYLEKRLGRGYRVVWQDYSTGAPITAQMVAGKIDIVGMGVSWICVISAEMISGEFGVGYRTWQAYTVVDYPGVLVGMLTIGLLGWITSALVELAGRRATRWQVAE